MHSIGIALVGDRSPNVRAHAAIPIALDLAGRALGARFEPIWVDTDAVGDGAAISAARAIWCIPGSPYRSMDGALTAIRHARERRVPFLGSCGGFQHAVIEFARNACGLTAADHAESSPDASLAIVAPLSCSLVGESGAVRLLPGTRAHAWAGTGTVSAEYHCRFGLDPRYREPLERGGLRISGLDEAGDVRAVELPDHPFFLGTLFQPELAALRGELHPLVLAFARAAAG